MKIAFFPSSVIPFHASTLEERPLGGTETAVIRLAAALHDLGHEVIVFSAFENPPLSSPLYLPQKAIGDLGPVDAFIAVREWRPLFLPVEAKKMFLWTGDSHDQPQTIGFSDLRIQEKIDQLLLVSEWHAESFCAASDFPRDKVRVLRNGIRAEYFAGAETRARKRLIYSSTPYRGLKHLLTIFPELLKKHPDAELDIFSAYDVYREKPGVSTYHPAAEKEFEILSAQFAELPNTTLRGNVKQSQLAREFMRSAILAYPNTFEETSCITVLESQAAGCVPVTSRKGALPESVGDAGILIEGEPGSAAYNAAFLDALDRLCSDDGLFEKLSKRGQERAKEFDWLNIAREFAEFIAET